MKNHLSGPDIDVDAETGSHIEADERQSPFGQKEEKSNVQYLLKTTQYLHVSDIIYEKQSIKKNRREAKYNKSGVNSYCVVF